MKRFSGWRFLEWFFWESRRMPIPQFSLKQLLLAVTIAAVLFAIAAFFFRALNRDIEPSPARVEYGN